MTRASHPLLCRSPLQAGESLPSLLTRLTNKNDYHSPTMLRQVCLEQLPHPDTVTRPTKTETYQVLADLVGITCNKLYAASVHRFATIITPPTFEQQAVRLPTGQTVFVLDNFLLRKHTWPESDSQFCPLCLNESAYHRVHWMPVATSVCLAHQCLLVRGCPNCRKSITISDILNVHCSNCTFDLTKTPITFVFADEFGLFSQMVIQSWLNESLPVPKNTFDFLSNQPPTILYHFLDGLRKAVMSVRHHWHYLYETVNNVGGVPFFPCRFKKDITPAKSYRSFATVFKGIVNWPQGFYDFLDAYKLRDDRLIAGYISYDLDYIHNALLEKAWYHPSFQFVQDVFDQYLLNHYVFSSSWLRLRRIRDNPVLRSSFANKKIDVE